MTCTAEPQTLTAAPLWTRARAMFARAVAAIGDGLVIAAITSLSPALRRQIVAWLSPLEHIVRKLLLAEAAELHRAARARVEHGPRLVRIPLRGMALHTTSQNGRLENSRANSPSPRGEGAGGGVNLLAASHAQTMGRIERCVDSARTPLHPAPSSPPRTGRDAMPASSSQHDLSHPETWPARFSFALPRDPLVVTDARAPRIRALWGPDPVIASAPERKPHVIKESDAPFRLARRFEALRRVLENPRPHAERLARVLSREVRRVPQLVMRYVLAGPRTDAFDPADSRLSIEALGAAFDAPATFKDTS